MRSSRTSSTGSGVGRGRGPVGYLAARSRRSALESAGRGRGDQEVGPRCRAERVHSDHAMTTSAGIVDPVRLRPAPRASSRLPPLDEVGHGGVESREAVNHSPRGHQPADGERRVGGAPWPRACRRRLPVDRSRRCPPRGPRRPDGQSAIVRPPATRRRSHAADTDCGVIRIVPQHVPETNCGRIVAIEPDPNWSRLHAPDWLLHLFGHERNWW